MKDPIYKIILLPVIFFGLLDILDFFFKDYIDRNEYILSTLTYIIIFFVVLSIIFLIVFLNSQESDKFIKIAKSFAFGVFFGLISTAYVGLVKDQTSFYLNRIFPQELIEEEFVVTYRHILKGDKLVGLRSVNKNYSFKTENKFSPENLIYIQKNDTIKIKYGIGLLNKPFLSSGKIKIIK